MQILDLPVFFLGYMAIWISFCLSGLLVLWIERKYLFYKWRDYYAFLCIPWKLSIFVPAFLFVSFAGSYTNDETWDVVSGSGMSLLTFATAPWSVGLIYQVFNGKRPLRYLIIALALLFFSSSWFYDAYLLWRDGSYTRRWFGNLTLSPIIYLAAGLLWNLEAKSRPNYTDRQHVYFSFVRNDWPSRPINTQFSPLFPAILPLVLIAFFVLVAFVRWHF